MSRVGNTHQHRLRGAPQFVRQPVQYFITSGGAFMPMNADRGRDG